MSDVSSLSATGIDVSFEGVHALRGVDISLPRDRTLGLIGPNGAGKTTLINVLSGFLKPGEGSLSVDGNVVTGSRPRKLVRYGIARTFQSVKLFPNLTVLENVEVAGVAIGLRRAQARATARDLLVRMDVMHLGDLPAQGLPHGYERRIGILRALASSPKYLLLDEPSAGLDERETDELIGALALIRTEFDCGLLVVEHDMRLIMGACDEIQVLAEGRTLERGTPREIRDSDAVVTAYLGSRKGR